MSKFFDNQTAVREIVRAGLDGPLRLTEWRKAVREALRDEEMSDGPKTGPISDADGTSSGARPSGPGARGTLETFATRVLSVVASNSQAARGALREDLLEDLIDAVRAFEGTQREHVLRQFRDAGISNANIVDKYLPAAARKLGADWCEDLMSFADVTIGSARLQAMLRDLRAPQVTDANALSVLLAVPADAYHTLGAGVVADQLRRLGVSPRMALGLSLPELAELTETHEFNAVMISAAASERLETLREMVNCIRNASHTVMPIVLGGSVTETDTDIKTLTGADYVSNNPEEALRACGLMIPTHAVGLPGQSDSGG